MTFGQEGDILDSRMENDYCCTLCQDPGCPEMVIGPDYPDGYRPEPASARDRQVAGSHYREATIQPYEYAMANGFGYCESLALRYLTRHRRKNGAEDLRKAVHCIELLIEAEYGGRE
jgi:hypothetical protein